MDLRLTGQSFTPQPANPLRGMLVHIRRQNVTQGLLQVFAWAVCPSAAIRQNYNEIADLCRKSSEPVFLTKNGEGDLVVMDIESFNRREKMLKLREGLLAVEEDRLAGRTGCSLDELESYLDNIIEEG